MNVEVIRKAKDSNLASPSQNDRPDTYTAAPYIVVDTASGIVDLVNTLASLPENAPSIYVDLEGVNFSPNGTISIMQIHVLQHFRTYLVDIHTLGDKAFSQSTSTGQTLRKILEYPSKPKVFFDVRNDADALFYHYRVELAGVQDLQLMELATRRASRKRVKGLASCIAKDITTIDPEEVQAWRAAKEKGLMLFAPDRGGSYMIFNERPLSKDIIQYCVQDVELLPSLWIEYRRKLTPNWKIRVEAESMNRVRRSISPSYQPHGKTKAMAPTGWAYIPWDGYPLAS